MSSTHGVNEPGVGAARRNRLTESPRAEQAQAAAASPSDPRARTRRPAAEVKVRESASKDGAAPRALATREEVPPRRARAAPRSAAGAEATQGEGSTIRTFFSSLGAAGAADALDVVDSGVAGTAGPGAGAGESGAGDSRAEALALQRYARSLARAEGAFDRARHEAESLRVERELLREQVTTLAEQLEEAECREHAAAVSPQGARSPGPASTDEKRTRPGEEAEEEEAAHSARARGGQFEGVSRPPMPGAPPRRYVRALWEALGEDLGQDPAGGVREGGNNGPGAAKDSASPAALLRAVREMAQSLHTARSEAAAAERARAEAEARAQKAEAASRRERDEYAAAAVRSLENQAQASQRCRVSEHEAERLRGEVERLGRQLADARAEAGEEGRRLQREREEAESRLSEVLQARQREAEEAEEAVARLRARLEEQAQDRERSHAEGGGDGGAPPPGGSTPASGAGEGDAQLQRAQATIESLERRVGELESVGERASAAMVEARRRALQAENEAEAAVAREREQQQALERAAAAQMEAVRDAEAARTRVAELERAVAGAEERAASEAARAEESARAASRAARADAKLRSTASALAAETARRETAEARVAVAEGALARGRPAGWATLRTCARYHSIVQARSSLRAAARSRRAALQSPAVRSASAAAGRGLEDGGDEMERVASFHRDLPRTDLLRRFAEKQTISILRQAPAWAKLDVELLRRFIAACDTVNFEPGDLIIKMGERGQRLYYILEVRAHVPVPRCFCAAVPLPPVLLCPCAPVPVCLLCL